MEKTGSISLGVVFIPRKNGDLGVERLAAILCVAFGLEPIRAEAGMQVPRHQLSIGAFFPLKN